MSHGYGGDSLFEQEGAHLIYSGGVLRDKARSN